MGKYNNETEKALAHLQGEHIDAADLQEKMKWARSGEANLVAPTPAVSSIPEGFSVALSVVEIDTEKDSSDIYSVGGQKYGLTKAPLFKIGGALGVTWDAHLSGRLDDGKTEHYCNFRAVGWVTEFDGSARQIVGTKEMDLRDGSAQVEMLWQRFEANKRKWDSGQRGNMKYPPKEPSGQIREMRLHLQSHAETKAQLRAIRSVGVKTSYTMAELKRPFVVARLHLTGRSKDPVLQREFATMVVSAHLQSRRALYGSGQAPEAAAQPPASPARHAAPPVEEVNARAEFDSDPGFLPPVSESNIIDAPPPTPRSAEAPQQHPAPPPQQEHAPQQSQRWQPPPQAQAQQSNRQRSGLTIPYGRDSGSAIEDVDDGGLRWFVGTIKEKQAKGEDNPKFRDANNRLVAAIERELASRQGGERF